MKEAQSQGEGRVTLRITIMPRGDPPVFSCSHTNKVIYVLGGSCIVVDSPEVRSSLGLKP